MSRPVFLARPDSGRGGFTLVEIMVAVALTLLMMTMVVSIFGLVMDNISSSRSTIEMTDKLRYTRERLQKDLAGITVTPMPPRRPEDGEGYLEIIEGPMGPQPSPGAVALDTDEPNTSGAPFRDLTSFDNTTPTSQFAADHSVGDIDDILMFTTKSQDEPFVGRFTRFDTTNVILDSGGNQYSPSARPNSIPATVMVESRVAEVAWFMRGTTLYRRVLLVAPSGVSLSGVTGNSSIPTTRLTDADGNSYSYYGLFDISAHMEDGQYSQSPNAGSNRLVANSLGDLTKRENRYAHQPYQWPYDARLWWMLGLPTLSESSHATFPFPWHSGAPSGGTLSPGGTTIPASISAGARPLISPMDSITGNALYATAAPNRAILTSANPFDAWRNPVPWSTTNGLAQSTLRVAEDVILTNVLSFDVKVWDPGAPLLLRDPTPAVPGDETVFTPNDATYLSVLDPTNTNTNYKPRMLGGLGAFVDVGGMHELDYVGGTPDGVIDYDPTDAAFWSRNVAVPSFMGRGNNPMFLASILNQFPYAATVYDTWSTHYEQDGIDQNGDGATDSGTDGIDNDGINGVDDPGEQEAPPPYAAPLRAIQVKIRVFDPDSRQVREVTLEHEFLPQ